MEHIHKTVQQKKDECIALLRSTKRDKIEDLISHITRMGYFEAPGSYRHHRFVGGLVSHSLETYHKAMALREEKLREGFTLEQMPEESVIIAALMHDLCKADVLRFNTETHRVFNCHSNRKGGGHSRRSVRMVDDSGFILTGPEREAILWHMGGKRILSDKGQRASYFATHPLSDIIRRADGNSIGDSQKRHHPERHG